MGSHPGLSFIMNDAAVSEAKGRTEIFSYIMVYDETQILTRCFPIRGLSVKTPIAHLARSQSD